VGELVGWLDFLYIADLVGEEKFGRVVTGVGVGLGI
jgi:hypothetical protein